MGLVGGSYAAMVALIASDRDCNSLVSDPFDSSEEEACYQAEETQRQVFTGIYGGLGVTAAITGLISTVLLQSDTNQQRRALLDAIDDADAGRLSVATPRIRLLSVAPWVDTRPNQTGGGLAFSGSF